MGDTVVNFQKYNKILSNVHKIGVLISQCGNNYYAKFEYKGMKIVREAILKPDTI